MAKKLNLTNQRFGKLLVVEEAERIHKSDGVMWLCKCDCGNFKVISSGNLRGGDTKSCGCLHIETAKKLGYGSKIDLTGQKFGKLLVLADSSKRTVFGHVLWLVKCDCGVVKEITTSNLHGTKSCGCYVIELLMKENPSKRPEIKKILSEQKLRENNPAWQGGISPIYHPNFTPAFCKKIRDLCGNKCKICEKTNDENINETAQTLHVHHIHYDPETNDCSNDTDFIALCTSCHTKTNFNRNYWENYFLMQFLLVA